MQDSLNPPTQLGFKYIVSYGRYLLQRREGLEGITPIEPPLFVTEPKVWECM